MSFQGLASALVVLIIIGIILGLLLDAQFERMRVVRTPTSEAPTGARLAASRGGGKAGQSAPSRQSSSLGELERREGELKAWEEELERRGGTLGKALPDVGGWGEDVGVALAAERERLEQFASALDRDREKLERARADFEAWKEEVEAELASERQALDRRADDLEAQQELLNRERADFQARMEETEARVMAEDEQLEAERESLGQAWNWAVLALCGAGALTIGNLAVAVARHYAGRREPGLSTTAATVRPRRACLRPHQASAAPRRRMGGRRVEGSAMDEAREGASIVWSELMGQQRHASVEAGWLGRAET